MNELLEFYTTSESTPPFIKPIAVEHANPPKCNGAKCGMSDHSASPAEARLNETLDELMPEMAELKEQVKRIVPQDVSLLLTGQTGTGKTPLRA